MTKTMKPKYDNNLSRLSLYPLAISEAYSGVSIEKQERTLRALADGNDFEAAMMYKAGLCYLQKINYNYEEVREWIAESADLMETSPDWFWDSIAKESKQFSKQMYNFKTRQ
jgi:hypothetical protein